MHAINQGHVQGTRAALDAIRSRYVILADGAFIATLPDPDNPTPAAYKAIHEIALAAVQEAMNLMEGFGLLVDLIEAELRAEAAESN